MAGELSSQEVRHVAGLARLALSDEEVERFRTQLSVVLGHVETIQALSTKDVAPTAHALALANVLRDDVVGDSLDRDEVLAAAPDVEAGRFRVPRILGELP